MAVHSQPLPLSELLPAGSRGFAVLDLETTGTGQLCRIVEIALLLLSPEGELQQEWTTLINPGVRIPNAAVHGIDDALATTAPAFADVAPELAGLVGGGQEFATATSGGLWHCWPQATPRHRSIPPSSAAGGSPLLNRI